MADALCGPSNALQSFQKHTSVDRSLQHDRLNLRQSPIQGFRSSPGPSPSNIDAQFRAFQSGSPLSGAASPLPLTQYRQVSHSQQPQLPSWAADFKQLNLGEDVYSPTTSQYHQNLYLQQNSPANGWHQDFLRQQDLPSASKSLDYDGRPRASIQAPMPQYAPVNASSAFMSPFAQQQEQQSPQQQDSLFDEALFAKAFDAAQREVDQAEHSTSKGKEREVQEEPIKFDMDNACTDPGDITGEYDFDTVRERVSEEATIVEELRQMRRDGGWQALEAYERAHEQELLHTQNQRSRDIVNYIRTLRAEEDAGWQQAEVVQEQIKIGADTIPAHNQEATSPDAEADALAKTAARLIDSLKTEQEEKFRNSSFLYLMRQLRDKEIRVDGDKMVKVSSEPHPGGKFYPYDAFDSNHFPPPRDLPIDHESYQVGA